ncbi:MAG: 4Fe-4S dicluster domain-containing protein [Clostridia bacterium]|nr:4Fe-4S dicluster domain-containing protein [Clostridia bacterium]
MRGIDTTIRRLRKRVFTEVAKLAYSGESINKIEEIPYIICPGDFPTYRDSVHLERAIASEQVRLALGLSLRPENRPVHITSGAEESNIAEKYYEPPLMQVIPSACDACPDNFYEVSDMCRACVAHPCVEVCPRGAVEFDGKRSRIDPEKCVKCGKCMDVCPYSAIVHRTKPCVSACGVGAIGSDEHGRAKIDPDKCVSCGMCMVSCPFGAIADKSQIFQLIRAMQAGGKVIAILAPAFVGQFGANVSAGKLKAALIDIGFADVYEVAIGADIGAMSEAQQYVEKVTCGELPFLLTSCCPSWSMLAKKQFPQMIGSISNELTPMVGTARIVKKENPEAKIVFVGPCAAKKLEASRRTVRSDVDFVITFEELDAMFLAKGIDFSLLPEDDLGEDATAAGRGYGVAGGVAGAIEECIKEHYPGTEVKIAHCEGLAECRKMLMMAKAGKMNGYLIEGMGCPGGCVAGAGTNISIPKAQAELKKFAAGSKEKVPMKE